MKKYIGNNFCNEDMYKLYRTVYDILFPTISKKNISNYKVILDEKLLPILVSYPKKISKITSVIIYVPSDGKVSGCFGKYLEICKNMALETNSVVIAIDYFDTAIKYPTIVNKISKVIKYLYTGLIDAGFAKEKITLMSDSVGCKILCSVIVQLISKNIIFSKCIWLYPVVRDSYIDYKWNDSLISINHNLDMRVNDYLKKYCSKEQGVSTNLLEFTYFKEFPRSLVILGDMDIFKDDGVLFKEVLSENGCLEDALNIKFASHGFLGCINEEILGEVYNNINKFVL